MNGRWRVALSGLLLLLLVLAPGAAGAQTGQDPQCPPDDDGYIPASCQLRASESRVEDGEEVSISGDGYGANVPIRIELRSDPVTIGNTTTNASGSFSTRVTIPAGTPAGRHTIAAIGNNPAGQVRELAFSITVVDQVGPGGLPRTGSSALPIAVVGVGLVAVGVVALRGAKRRTAEASEA
jgi:hypothetical protein